ncbi:hypothetical protein ACT4UT_29930, partial [Bacillus sp. B-TM1]
SSQSLLSFLTVNILYKRQCQLPIIHVLVDADDAGEKLRKQFRKEFPQAEHIYIDRSYREVATAPSSHLANVLWGADIDVYTEYLR